MRAGHGLVHVRCASTSLTCMAVADAPVSARRTALSSAQAPLQTLHRDGFLVNERAPVSFSAELAAEPGAGFEEPAFDRADGHGQGRSDLGVVEAIDVMEHYHAAERRR